MDLHTTLNVIQIIVSIGLVVTILMQQQGSGLGTMFGGGGGGESFRSKRGAEKVLFNATIILLTVFIINGLAIAILSAQT